MEQVKVKPIVMPAVIAAVFMAFDNFIGLSYAVQMMMNDSGYMDFIPYFGVINAFRSFLCLIILILLVIGLILLLVKPVAGLGTLIAPVVLSFVTAFLSGIMYIGVTDFNLVSFVTGIIVASSLLVAVIGGLATQKRAFGAERKILNAKFTVIAMDLVFLGLLISRVWNAVSVALSGYSYDGSNSMLIIGTGSLGIIIALLILIMAIIFGKKTKAVISVLLIILGVIGFVVALIMTAISVADWSIVIDNPLLLLIYLEFMFGPIIASVMGIYGLTIKNDVESYQVQY